MNRTVICTTLALLAFALNSILCRLALRGGEADAVGFTLVRIFSGAMALAAIAYIPKRDYGRLKKGSWISAICIFAYAISFSLAYKNLSASTGALLLFGAVQMGMIAIAVFRGERPSAIEWIGIGIAIVGLVVLLLPDLASPPLSSALLMAAAGIAWAFYSIRGKGSDDPVGETAGNFIRCTPLTIVILLPAYSMVQMTGLGVLLAAISGVVTSGIGYAIWYTALRELSTPRAAVLQLAVPVITAVIGIALLSEVADLRLLGAGVLVLGGIALTILGKSPSEKSN